MEGEGEYDIAEKQEAGQGGEVMIQTGGGDTKSV